MAVLGKLKKTDKVFSVLFLAYFRQILKFGLFINKNSENRFNESTGLCGHLLR